MPAPTLLVITHSHYDHFDPETLKELPKDVPVVLPPDSRLGNQLRSIGFTEFRVLDTWKQISHGSVRLTATPSEADVSEFGLLVETDDALLWHMSDAEPPVGTSLRILSEVGAVDVVSVKYQPPDPLLNFLHNLGSSFDRRSTARWLEEACACRPKLVFPYASGLCLTQDHAWLNRFAYPFSPEFVSAVLRERLTGIGESDLVRPGDMILIDRLHVRIERQASAFVRQCDVEASIDWEPIEADLLGKLCHLEDKTRLKDELTQIVEGGELSAWLQANPKLVEPFVEWRVLCQFAVHLDETERLYFEADFTGSIPEVRLGRRPTASYFLHVGGDAAMRLLAGHASSAEVMYQGSVRVFERIVSVRDGKVDAPDAEHTYGTFPDPFLCFANARARTAKHLRDVRPA